MGLLTYKNVSFSLINNLPGEDPNCDFEGDVNLFT